MMSDINPNLINKHVYYNNKFFARWAKLYDYERFLLFPLRRAAAKFLKPASSHKLLDVATGTGAQAYEFAKLGYDVTGIDLSPEMLKQAHKKVSSKISLQFKQADATNLPFKDNTYDISSISLGLHDMPTEIGIKVLNEMKRVTKKGGEILIIDYMEPRKHPVAKLSHLLVSLYETPMYKPFIKTGLDRILERAKLRPYRMTNFLGVFQIVVAINNKQISVL